MEKLFFSVYNSGAGYAVITHKNGKTSHCSFNTERHVFSLLVEAFEEETNKYVNEFGAKKNEGSPEELKKLRASDFLEKTQSYASSLGETLSNGASDFDSPSGDLIRVDLEGGNVFHSIEYSKAPPWSKNDKYRKALSAINKHIPASYRFIMPPTLRDHRQ